jgi:hypothetical protein
MRSVLVFMSVSSHPVVGLVPATHVFVYNSS